jgi:hypothetical protein
MHAAAVLCSGRWTETGLPSKRYFPISGIERFPALPFFTAQRQARRSESSAPAARLATAASMQERFSGGIQLRSFLATGPSMLTLREPSAPSLDIEVKHFIILDINWRTCGKTVDSTG